MMAPESDVPPRNLSLRNGPIAVAKAPAERWSFTNVHWHDDDMERWPRPLHHRARQWFAELPPDGREHFWMRKAAA